MLLPSPEILYIAPLLVILHQIPLARRALLNDSQDIVHDYGYEEDWWNGYIIDLSSEFEHSSNSIHSYSRMMVETQRLMAFLDGGSRRPYAHVKNLALAPPISSLPSLKGEVPNMNPVGRFLEDLMKHSSNSSLVSSVFETSAVYVPNQEVRTFSNFSTDVSLSLSSPETLFDLVDEMVWPLGETPETYLSSVGDVITLTLRRDDAQSGAGIDVPLTFLPDRYTLPFLSFIKMLRDRRKEYQHRIGILRNKRFTMMNYMGKDTSKLLQITSDYLRGLSSRNDEEKEDGDDSDAEDFDYTGLEAAAEDLKHAEELFSKKKSFMTAEMQDLQNEMNLESKLFKGADDLEIFEKVFPGQDYPPMRVFNLSGVILSPAEYCFCRRAPENLIDVDEEFVEDMENPNITSTKPEFEWWKVSSSLTNEVQELPVAIKLSAEEVVALAKNGSTEYGSQEVVLVYATADVAWDNEKNSVDLSAALQLFVDEDRKSLLDKLRKEEAVSVVLGDRNLSSESLGRYSYSATPEDQESSSRVEVISIKDDESDATGSEISSMPSLLPTKASTHEYDVATVLMNDADADAMELEFEQRKS